MTNFDLFDTTLSEAITSDRLYDQIMESLAAITDRFDPNDWERLTKYWQMRDRDWAAASVEILVSGTQSAGLNHLVNVVQDDPRDEIAVIAADALRARLGTQRILVSTITVDRVRYLASRSNGLVTRSLDDLLRLLITKYS